MDSNLTEQRQQAHALLDMLPDEKLAAVRSLLQVMIEPLSHSLASAPVDDEELMPDTVVAVERARLADSRRRYSA